MENFKVFNMKGLAEKSGVHYKKVYDALTLETIQRLSLDERRKVLSVAHSSYLKLQKFLEV